MTEVNPMSGSCSLTDYQIAGFKLTPNHNLDEIGKRGVAIYVHESLENRVQPTVVGSGFDESVWCKLKLKGSDQMLIGVIYRSPSSDNMDPLKSTLIDAGNVVSSYKCIVGDFNMPRINWRTPNSCLEGGPEEKLVDAINEGFLYQHVTEPTRTRGSDEPHVLDLVLTNEEDMLSNLTHCAPLGKSDHQVLVFDVQCSIDWSKPKETFNFDRADYDEARKQLREVPIDRSGSVEQRWTHLKDTILSVRDNCVPKRTVGRRRWKGEYPCDSKVFKLLKMKDKSV